MPLVLSLLPTYAPPPPHVDALDGGGGGGGGGGGEAAPDNANVQAADAGNEENNEAQHLHDE